MCGRFGFFELKYFIEQLRQLDLPFEEDDGFHFNPGFNIAPGSRIAILKGNHDSNVFANAGWGLVPHWSEHLPKVRPINARAESIAVKPYFRHALNRNHCLVPASGFYEWKESPGGKKLPWYVHRADNKPMAFAGLWESWTPADNASEALHTCTIITTTANREMRAIHQRMPVILEPDTWRIWLDSANQDNRSLLVTPEDEILDLYPVSTKVNNPRYISKDCIERVNDETA